MNTTWLHTAGEAIRAGLETLPLSWVRVLFVGLYAALLVGVGAWSWREVKLPGEQRAADSDSRIRWWHLALLAATAIILQGIVYSVL